MSRPEVSGDGARAGAGTSTKLTTARPAADTFYLMHRDEEGMLPADRSAGLSWRCMQVHRQLTAPGFRAMDWMPESKSLQGVFDRASARSSGGATGEDYRVVSTSPREEMLGAFAIDEVRHSAPAVLRMAVRQQPWQWIDSDFRLLEAVEYVLSYFPRCQHLQLFYPQRRQFQVYEWQE